MSADNVIDTLQGWLAPPNVIGLNAVLDAAPWFLDGYDWQLDQQLGWGAVGVLHIAHEDETRAAMGPIVGGVPTGMKEYHYDVGIITLFKYVIPALSDQSLVATGYRRALNGLLDGIKVRLRAYRTQTAQGAQLTPEGTVLFVGEGDTHGSPDIVLDRDLPRRDIGVLWSKNLITFHVVEVAQA